MLKIRLQKVGKKNSPSYRVVLAEHTAPPQGKFIEILGFYNARLKKKGFKKDRIEYWLSRGAQPSPTVHNLLIDEGVLKGIKLKAWRPKRRKEGKAPTEVPTQVGTEVTKKSAEPPTKEKKKGPGKKEEKPAEAKTEDEKKETKEEKKEEKESENPKEEEKKDETLDKE